MSDQASRLRRFVGSPPGVPLGPVSIRPVAGTTSTPARDETVVGDAPRRSTARTSVGPPPSVASVSAASVAGSESAGGAESPARSPRLAHAIAIASGKGGVGKTTISVALASALAARGRRTWVVDGDLGLGNADVAFGVTPRATLGDVIAARRPIADAVTPVSPGLGVLAAGNGVAALAAAPAGLRSRLVDALGEAERAVDALVVDCGAGVGPTVLALAGAADRLLVVATAERASIVDAYGLIKCLGRRDPNRRFGLIVNRVRTREEGPSVHRRLASVARNRLGVTVDLAAVVPDDAAVRRAGDLGRPVTVAEPASGAARAIDAMAMRVSGANDGRGAPLAQPAVPDLRGGGFGARVVNWLMRT